MSRRSAKAYSNSGCDTDATSSMTSKVKSYPRPSHKLEPFVPFPVPAALRPLQVIPTPTHEPQPLPSRGILDNWNRSTHLLPAAWPRAPTLAQPTGKVSVEELRRWRAEHYTGRTERLPQRTEVLWIPAERWVSIRHPPRTGVTLVCTHPNGMHKETWDETLRNLLCKTSAGALVDEVWTLDAVTQGDGGRVNAANLPDLFDWTDNARDVVNFLTAYLPSSSSTAVHPPILRRVPESEIDDRRTHGFRERRVVGLGHSMGAAALVLACDHVPKVFDSLILCDPVVAPPGWPGSHYALTALAIRRRDVWPDRKTMRSLLSKSSFFASWHPAVLQSYVMHGTYKTSPDSDEVRLKCTPYQEASSFSEARVSNYAWLKLSTIPEDISILWILSGKDNTAPGGDDSAQTVWRRGGNTRNVIVDANHLIPQEKPDVVAAHIAGFLVERFSTMFVLAKF